MNNFLQNLTIYRNQQRAFLLVKKYSPEILLAGGILSFLGTIFLSNRATVKAVVTTEEFKETIKLIEEVRTNPASLDKYSKEDYIRDRNNAVTSYILELVRLYGPSAILGFVSIGSFIGSYRIVAMRNVAIASALKMLSDAYIEYRNRVKEEFGEEVDKYIRYKKPFNEEMQVVDKKGKPVPFDELEVDLDGERFDYVPSMYGVFFDESSHMWRNDTLLNETVLRSQEIYANDLLNARGHLFLNEVYDMIGVPRTKEGAIVGWVKNNPNGDNFVDFGIYNPFNKVNRDYINRYNARGLFLDFNVDGVIYNLI